MHIQTVFRAGNSDVVAIPKDLSKELGIKAGQKVVVDKIPGDRGLIITKPRKIEKHTGVTAEFKKWLEKVLEEDKEILDELALR